MNQRFGLDGVIPVEMAGSDERARFITRTYVHLFLAIMAFTGFEVLLFKSGAAYSITVTLLGSRFGWLLALGGFVILGNVASKTAWSANTTGAQYAALALYVVLEGIIFAPLLFIADHFAPGAIRSAALVTAVSFTALTCLVVYTGKDFAFLGVVLKWGFIMALVLIVAALIFGFQLGVVFSVAMVGLAGGAILYDTSNIMRRYPVDRHVSAALELFAAVALMFWYILRLFMAARD